MMKVTLKIAALLVLLAGMAFLIRSGSDDVKAQGTSRVTWVFDRIPSRWTPWMASINSSSLPASPSRSNIVSPYLLND